MKPHERRYQAGRPYYRPRGKHQVSRREDHIFAVVFAVFVGGLIGATVTLAAITSGVIVL